MELDHLAVTAATLEAAVDRIETALGVAMAPGGRHEMFGTWNRLLGLGPAVYLEAIAADPGAPPPARARWFGLDAPGPAGLSAWICRVADLAETQAGLGYDAGRGLDLARGDLRWRMAVPEAGRSGFDGLAPWLISWQGAAHPCDRLADSGCRLRRLVVAHPEAGALGAALTGLDGAAPVVFEPGAPGLLAEIDTPHGLRVLR